MTLANQALCNKVTTLVLLIMSVIFLPAYAQQSMTVLVPNFPPYTHIKNNELTGVGIQKADMIFAQAKIKVTYRFLPNYAKVLHEIKQGRGDAFLLASQNDERDKVAQFSLPIVTNKWCWYLSKNSPLSPQHETFKANATISSHFNTNTHKWLNSKGYFVEPVMDISVLPELLLRKRIDAVFLAELVFEQAIKDKGLPLSNFKKVVEVEKPFGIYVSNKYLESSPNALKNINKSILNINTPKNTTQEN